jgi:hypothetical protein
MKVAFINGCMEIGAAGVGNYCPCAAQRTPYNHSGPANHMTQLQVSPLGQKEISIARRVNIRLAHHPYTKRELN